MVKVAPSVLSADFSKIDEWLPAFESAKADMIQWDIMDNRFVPNTGVDMKWIPVLREKTRLFFDCHLMVEKPETYFEALNDYGADSITFHVEASKKPLETIQKIRDLGLGAGIAINAKTKPEKIIPFLHKVDLALVMSVNAGVGGQKFIPGALQKVKKLDKEIKKEDMLCEIQVDGGINLETGKKAVAAGAEILVAGSFVFKYGSITDAITKLKRLG